MCTQFVCIIRVFSIGISHILWYSNSGDSVVNSTTGTTTWPGTVVNQATHLVYTAASLVQRSRGRVGPADVILLCVTLSFSIGV